MVTTDTTDKIKTILGNKKNENLIEKYCWPVAPFH